VAGSSRWLRLGCMCEGRRARIQSHNGQVGCHIGRFRGLYARRARIRSHSRGQTAWQQSLCRPGILRVRILSHNDQLTTPNRPRCSPRPPQQVPTSRGIAESREMFRATSQYLQDRRRSREILRFPDRRTPPPTVPKPRNQADSKSAAIRRTTHKVSISRPSTRCRGDFQRNIPTSCHSRPRERDIKKTRHARYPGPRARHRATQTSRNHAQTPVHAHAHADGYVARSVRRDVTRWVPGSLSYRFA
jgi:hypothetical protein